MRDYKKFAATMWKKIESNLDDRGCFNDIDEDVMRDLRKELKQQIADDLQLIVGE